LIRVFFQRQITEHNSSQACLAGTIPNFIIFDKMKDKLVVNSITKFDRYWSGETAQCSESPIFRNLNIPKNSPPGKILKYFKWHKTLKAFRLHSRAETLTGLSRISLFLGNICLLIFAYSGFEYRVPLVRRKSSADCRRTLRRSCQALTKHACVMHIIGLIFSMQCPAGNKNVRLKVQ